MRRSAIAPTRGGGPVRGRPAALIARAIDRAEKALDAAIRAHTIPTLSG
jgi:hypothetical protein